MSKYGAMKERYLSDCNNRPLGNIYINNLSFRERAFNMKRLGDLKARDTNGDNMISWEEYLTSEAPVILARDATRLR